MPPDRWKIYLACGLVLVAATFVLDSPVLDAIVYVGAGLSAAIALLLRAPHAPPERSLSWRLLGVGIALFMVGDATWNVFDLVLGEPAPFPSAADGAYLLGYVGLVGGIATLGLRHSTTEARRAFMDGLIVALGTLVFFWELLIEPYWLDPTLPLTSRLVSAAYPLMDLVLLCMILGLLFSGVRRSVSYSLLVAAIGLNLLGDVVYSIQTLEGTYRAGTLLDATWMVAYVCLGTAALHPTMATVGEIAPSGRDHRPRLWVLGAAAASGPAALLLGIGGENPEDLPVLRSTTLILIVLAILRISALMRDLRQKVEELRRQEEIAQRAVAEQLRSAEELRRNEARFRSLVVNMSDVICLADANGEILYASPPVERVLGYRPEQLVGRNGFDLIHPEEVPKLEAVLERILRGERAEFETRVMHENGSVRWVQVTVDNHLEEPELGAIVAVYRDVTEAKLLEQQLLQAQKMEAVGQLAGGVAHDFNNILSVISNYAEFVIEDLPPGDPKREDVEEIQKASRRAGDLVRQLLTFSRREVVRRRVLEINSVIFEMQKLLRRAIPESVDISVNLTATPAYVDADPTQVEQILMNLCVNARDAMLDGGRLEIITKVTEVSESFAHRRPGLRSGAYVVLSVCDTGIGMEVEVQRHAFEPFFTTKERGQGTGLGLATVYGIVDRLGGYIDVNSQRGKGTTMNVYLPSSDQTEDVGDDAPRIVRSGGGETILVAEDETAVRNLVERILAREGYEVLVASSGDEALDMASAQERIDMLLTDVVMPEMSGKDLAERITQARPGLPTLFMSGYTDDIVARHGILEEGEALIQKPFDARGLLNKVREVLEGAGDFGLEHRSPSPSQT